MAQGIVPVFTHADFLIFNKPQDVSFHSENGTGFFANIQQLYPDESLFPVHRLDKITSGLTIIARHKEAARTFGKLFSDNKIQKTYLALSDKKPAKKQGMIIGDMTRTRNGNWKLTRFRENPAITRFTTQPLANEIRLFALKPSTGRTHQLRVMMKSVGSPILGDVRYGGSPADRGYLHAASLTFLWENKQISCMQTPETGNQFNLLEADVFHQLAGYVESGC